MYVFWYQDPSTNTMQPYRSEDLGDAQRFYDYLKSRGCKLYSPRPGSEEK